MKVISKTLLCKSVTGDFSIGDWWINTYRSNQVLKRCLMIMHFLHNPKNAKQFATSYCGIVTIRIGDHCDYPVWGEHWKVPIEKRSPDRIPYHTRRVIFFMQRVYIEGKLGTSREYLLAPRNPNCT